MNKKHLLHLTLFLFAFFIMHNSSLQAQICSGEAPVSFTIVPNPANPTECFLQIDWGAAMPEIICGDTGTPAPGSTIPSGRRIDFLYATFNGVTYTLLDRLECPNGTNMLMYGNEPNTFITFLPEVDFCSAEGERFIQLEGIQLGSPNFNCLVPNGIVAAPIELAYFKGSTKDKSNLLEWATSSEENTATFVVERSLDGRRNIETVGTKDAQGFSYEMEYYQLEDRSPRALAYYRLRAIDFDGSEMASDWVAVHRKGNTSDHFVQIAPVPLGKEPLQIQYEAQVDETVIVSISDINGRQLWEERKELEAGIHNWSLEFPDFQQHMLIFKLHHRDGVISRLIPCESGR